MTTQDTAYILRKQIVRAVVGRKVVAIEDESALDRICQRLAEAEQAHEILKALGYGQPWNSIDELAQMVPHATVMLVRLRK